MRDLRRKSGWWALFLLGITGFVPAQSRAQQPEGWISRSGASVTTGDYGTGEDTTVMELAQTLKYRWHKGELGVVVPYVVRRGAGVTAGESRRSAQSGVIPENASGLGDIRLKGKRYWIEETDVRPAVDLGGFVKIPTASEDDGLGTGHVDAGFGPEFFKRFNSLFLFGDTQLVVRDRPSGSTIKPARLDYLIGAGVPLDRWTISLSLQGGTQANAGADPPMELVASGSYRTSTAVGLEGFLLAGLTDGSPDFGAGAGVNVQF